VSQINIWKFINTKKEKLEFASPVS